MLLVVTLVLAVAFWRTATSLEGHVRAGAQAIVEALAAQTRSPSEGLSEVHRLVPGMGQPVPLTVAPQSAGVGRSLKELNLRGLTGATVLAIRRDGAQIVVPEPSQVLQAGDVLALGGTNEAIESARELLKG